MDRAIHGGVFPVRVPPVSCSLMLKVYFTEREIPCTFGLYHSALLVVIKDIKFCRVVFYSFPCFVQAVYHQWPNLSHKV